MVKSQRNWNIGFSLFLMMLVLLLLQINATLALILILGTALGFTSALRDPLITGITQATQAVILLIGLSLIGYWIILINSSNLQTLLRGVVPFGYHTVVGGILFGIGMVIAGGCVSGILMRIGEGFVMQMVAFLGLLIGALVANQTQGFWKNTFGEWQGIFLPDIIGWLPALFLQLGILAGLWILAYSWQKRKFG
jgi:uncharacterized membrane protein YedE/YeeE